ncbi:MAG: lipoprotein releasing system ATP-binding protein [uncultured bacterium]|nr:MAG: lipoprotein releasing system ATP-binding protein [uncultured bacterium]OGN55376.1 MAG: hypothetical protein A2796_02450 [Chlamydiae bacterium RIFCSPHIGHO2_01_FULL_44_39]OGN58232.1 MAG: hypothetical protein A3C42_01795 [Chlamydiae bacterium RIFCSPHIGHO2_02_FULL_45_9]OGN59879.1 MAG: hypothetical protein A3D96_03765 [Chlamydiae bacterium RIFCSPHIGHO2_12_FULL_44_59]OGN66086.1 MAG: hypothetical protein A2978_04280 [Chlamydiae bacterium RIFCSPLOWO2_01_FULL_44_52]OGN68622.1 MAG: hypothetical 
MIFRATNISKSYGKLQVLKNVSLTLESGQSIAILGRSGEGKTTLLHILAKLEEPDSGQIEMGEKILSKANAHLIRRHELGYIFQSYNLLEDFTALENVLMPARIARIPAPKEKGLKLLEDVGLASKADIAAKHLSGGERQRVAIARARCNNPHLILADEPTGNLDRENRDQVGRLLKGLQQSLILVTHDPTLASLCDRQYVLENGSLFPLARN